MLNKKFKEILVEIWGNAEVAPRPIFKKKEIIRRLSKVGQK